jgi:putative transcriptional regulator
MRYVPVSCAQTFGPWPPTAAPADWKHCCPISFGLDIVICQGLPLMVPWAISPSGECGPGGCTVTLSCTPRCVVAGSGAAPKCTADGTIAAAAIITARPAAAVARRRQRIRLPCRIAAAQREVWTGTQLRRLLAEKAGLELSAASVSALFTREPAQVKLSTLAALCTALECTPDDLFEVDTTPVARPAPPRPAEQPQAVPVRGRSMPPL